MCQERVDKSDTYIPIKLNVRAYMKIKIIKLVTKLHVHQGTQTTTKLLYRLNLIDASYKNTFSILLTKESSHYLYQFTAFLNSMSYSLRHNILVRVATIQGQFDVNSLFSSELYGHALK